MIPRYSKKLTLTFSLHPHWLVTWKLKWKWGLVHGFYIQLFFPFQINFLSPSLPPTTSRLQEGLRKGFLLPILPKKRPKLVLPRNSRPYNTGRLFSKEGTEFSFLKSKGAGGRRAESRMPWSEGMHSEETNTIQGISCCFQENKPCTKEQI